MGKEWYPMIGSQRKREPHLLGSTCLEHSFDHTGLGRNRKEAVRAQVQQNLIVPLEFGWILNMYFFIFCIPLRQYPDTWNGWVWRWLLCLHHLHQLCLSHCAARHRAPHTVFLELYLSRLPSLTIPLPRVLVPWNLSMSKWNLLQCYHPGFWVHFELGNPSMPFLCSTGSLIFKHGPYFKKDRKSVV